MSDKEDLEREWYGMLPDAERAEVLKSLISERGQTRRAEIDADKQVHEVKQKTEGFHIIRGLALCTLVIGIAVTGSVTCHAIDVFAPPAPARPVTAATSSVSASASASAVPSASSDAK